MTGSPTSPRPGSGVHPGADQTESYAVRCEDLTLYFPSRDGRPLHVLDRISLEVRPGELLCIVGPSGSGKTTILNAVAGLLNVTSGRVLLYGERVTGVRSDVAYMTQTDTLFPWLTAARNVHLPLEAAGQRDPKLSRAHDLLKLVGLSGFEDHYPHQLSGGMRKRVQLARSLAQDPRVLLMDEPFGALDYQTRLLIHQRFLEIWDRDRKTAIFVTHDLNEAIALADRILLVSHRPARIREEYTVGIERPRHVDQLVDIPEYRELYHDMWRKLQQEFDQAPPPES